MVAVAGAVLLVGAATSAGAVPQTVGNLGTDVRNPASLQPAGIKDDDIRDQLGAKCDTTEGDDNHFYNGPSASKTYDQLFSRLGRIGDPIPALKDPHPYTPQGLGYWENWDGKGNDLLLVTAYRDGERSLIHGLDAETGAHVGGAAVKASHVGGIAVIGDWAYVSGRLKRKLPDGDVENLRTIRRYDVDKLRTKIEAEGYQYLKFEKWHEEDVVPASSFLGTDGSTLYAGPYDKTGLGIMRAYKPRDDGSLRELDDRYTTPRATQGMTVVDGNFVFSVSSDHDDGLRSYLYVMDSDTSKPFECFRAPSMAEGLATHGDETFLVFESGSDKFETPVNVVNHVHKAELDYGDDDEPGGRATTTTYTGPTEADYHDSFKASARLTGAGGPISGARIDLSLGNGGGSQSCAGTTDGSGVATCSLTPTQAPGRTALTARFEGAASLQPSSDSVAFTVTRQETAAAYTGPERIANGTPARLSGVLTEESQDGPPVSDRSVTLALGEDGDRQECSGTTGEDGTVACTIESVNQPLNEDATVPVSVEFDGDTYYEPSVEHDTVLLEYYTGRSYGAAATLELPGGLDLGLPEQPDTGPIRTAQASRAEPGCTASFGTAVVRAETLCPRVVTSLAPGTSRATSSVEDASIGLPGVPLIEVEGASARSISTCEAGGSAKGTTDVRLRIGGELVEVTGEANAEIELPGDLVRLTVNEQRPVPGADHGLTVNAVHLTAVDGTADIVVGSATSDVHNCAS